MKRILVLLMIAAAASAAPSPSTKESLEAMKPAEALERLKQGNGRFLGGAASPRDLKAQVKATASGQYPFAGVLSCMDSRVPPEIVFDQGIGDLFVVRVAGNVVDTDDLGSLEYATKVVGSKLILVMGHTSCGAVKGAIDDVKLGNLTFLLEKIRPVIAASGPGTSHDAAYVDKVAQSNVRQTIREIREKSPIIRELADSGKIGLAGAMYDVATGKVTFLAD
jgi:carbonic anhydrase